MVYVTKMLRLTHQRQHRIVDSGGSVPPLHPGPHASPTACVRATDACRKKRKTSDENESSTKKKKEEDKDNRNNGDDASNMYS